MSLEDIQQALLAQKAKGTLVFSDIGVQVLAVSIVMDSLPPLGLVELPGPSIVLQGKGVDQQLTIKDVITWGIWEGVTATIVITSDPTTSNYYLADLTFEVPPSFSLSIPAVSWFKLGQFKIIAAYDVPFAYASSGLLPGTTVGIGTTLIIEGDNSRTTIPIQITSDPLGVLLLSLNTASIDLPSINDILAVFGNADGILLPDTINQMTHFSLLELQVGFDPEASAVTLIGVQIGNSAQAQEDWQIVPGILALHSYSIGLTIVNPLSTRDIGGLIAAQMTIGSVDIAIAALHPSSGGWLFKGMTLPDETLPIGKLISYIGEKFGVNDLPDWFTGITLENLAVDFDTLSGNFHFNVTGTIPLSAGILAITLLISVERQAGSGYAKMLRGTITFGTALFEFDFLSKTNTNSFAAIWQETAGQGLGFVDLAEALGLEPPALPDGLDLAFSGASLFYDSAKKEFVLSAISANYGSKAVFVTLQHDGLRKYAFVLAIDKSMNVSNLPLLSRVLSDVQTISVSKIQVIIANAPVNPDTAVLINALIPHGYPVIPTNGTATQMSIAATIDFGGDVIPLSLDLGGSGKSTAMNLSGEKQSRAVQALSSSATDGTTWFRVQKTFGPVTFSQVGVRYQDAMVWFLLDASLTVGGVSISFEGLSIGSSIKNFDPQFNLAGLGLLVKEPSLEIGGSLLHVPAVPPINFEFDGSAVIKATEFSIAAYGSYVDLNGQPSMFIFAQIQHAFGGPPMFFVTGLTAGFGYNSHVRIPAQDEVSNFPLVAGLSNPAVIGGKNASPLEALAKMTGGSNPWISPAAGQIWAAAGVMFTSFELVKSNALLIAEFGQDLTIALIGLSTARFPQEGPKIYSQVELQLEAIFQPSQGVFSVTAILSRNSYLLDPSCMLTGGFAFFIWFQNSQHAGDFVITIGGYHPMFDKAAWYPVVPAVGFNWPLDSHVSISGSTYFALTPAGIMAGGALAINFHDGRLKAWFIAHADLLILWKPFHFSASLGVSIGISYTFDFLFTTKTFTAELGVDLDLWGPPTGGRAHIYWWIISFTVEFGSLPPAHPDPLPWTQFQTLLPQTSDVLRIMSVNGLASQEKIDTGAAGTEDEVQRWIVRADTFQCSISSLVPASQIFLGSASKTPFKTKDPLNIRPMQKTNLISAQRVIIWAEDGTDVTLSHGWQFVETVSNVPKALWGTATGGQVEQGSEQLVPDQLTGLSLNAPVAKLGHSEGLIDIAKNLSYDPLSPEGISPLSEGLSPVGDRPQTGQNTIQMIEREIMSDPVKSSRDQLFSALQGLGYDAESNDVLTTFASQAGSLYNDEPMIVL